jgi:hypothetical protein
MDVEKSLYQIVSRELGVPLDGVLVSQLGVSKDFIRGMALVGKDYRMVDDIVMLSGLGVTKCVVCGDADRIFYSTTAVIQLPSEMLNGKVLDPTLSNGIIGHRKCYKTIDAYFRVEGQGLVCWDCSSWSGGFVDGDEVMEKCRRLHEETTGHQGVLGSNPICNFYKAGFDVEEKDKQTWERIKPEVEARTNKGYQNLIERLTKLHLIKSAEGR